MHTSLSKCIRWNNFDEAYLKLSYDFGGFGVNGGYYIGVDSELKHLITGMQAFQLNYHGLYICSILW